MRHQKTSSRLLLELLLLASLAAFTSCDLPQEQEVCTKHEDCGDCNLCVNGGCVLDTTRPECNVPPVPTPNCGDGVVQAPESCDTGITAGSAGACPTSCDDAIACTTDSLVNAGTCTASCSHTPITGCTNGDGCCPAGCAGTDSDCISQPGWVSTVGGTGDDQVIKTVTDSQGNVYVMGSFDGTATAFGNKTLAGEGGYDIFLAKLSPSGNVLWVTTAGGPSDEYPRSMVLDKAGNLVVAGEYHDDATFGSITLFNEGIIGGNLFVAKVKGDDGTFVWAIGAGQSPSTENTNGESADALAVDASNNIYVAGQYEETFSLGAFELAGDTNQPSLFVAKLAPDGQVIWAKKVAQGMVFIDGLAVDGTGSGYLGGTLAYTATLGTKQYTAQGEPDIYVARISSAGAVDWVVTAGGMGDEDLGGIAVDGSGSALITGRFQGLAAFGNTALKSGATNDSQIFVAKLAASGQWTWATAGGGAGDDDASSIVVLPGGDALVAGTAIGPATFGTNVLAGYGDQDVLIARISSAGAWGTAILAGGSKAEWATSVALGPGSTMVVGGSFDEQLNLAGKTFNAAGGSDALLWSSTVP